MEKFLIIGGTGNIGFPLIEFLNKQANIQIVAGSHNPDKAQEKFQGMKNVVVKKFDFLDSTTFADAFDGVSKVFFVRPPQLGHPKQDMLPFLRYVQSQAIDQIVFVSLLGVEKNPMTPHHQIEQMILKLNIPYTFIRPSFFMQNLDTTHLFDIKNNHDLFIPAGNSRTSFIDTRDIGEIAGITMLDDKYLFQKLNITGPQTLNYQEIAQVMTQVLGVNITYSKPSLLKFRQTMLKRGLKKDFVNVMVMLYLITQLGNAKEVTDTAKKVLGHKPRNIKDYVEDYRNYFI
ncbi:hypothetical protein C5L30_001931 [Companilactobacillus farciminis]|uniref:NmrA-like domain-containing protein n=1 Tax=Companilactobacillus farciminis TaxID=1612 RepID=A0A4R5NC41_9LACO|nr:NmrA family NAD(P)-binding protein [Companilactobacillus farciminis]ATO45455.1 NAD(P)-dependent oxidoreductase [Companilactobacillus farciminis KCTC 3681 = DSM 20184]KRK61629.1 hypothetical protein FC68_GL000691 [Companilactobacillus farciminis KCTC 3681 = DSM 20184]TDG69798.1 hypothetical protein C5L30_001931 [Companilactobacillus farciminis]